MIYYKNNTWNFHNFKVNFENKGNTEEKYTSDKDYWMNMENNNDNITNVAFQEFNPTETQLNRLEEINQQNVTEGFKPFLIRYINTGKLTKIEVDEETGNEVELEVKSNMEFPMGKFKNYLENKQTNIDLSEREIREIEQGQELSELEIRILELEGGTA